MKEGENSETKWHIWDSINLYKISEYFEKTTHFYSDSVIFGVILRKNENEFDEI